MLRVLKRTALALLLMVAGLVLVSLGVSAGGWLALAGLLAAPVVNLLGPWPWQRSWRE